MKGTRRHHEAGALRDEIIQVCPHIRRAGARQGSGMGNQSRSRIGCYASGSCHGARACEPRPQAASRSWGNRKWFPYTSPIQTALTSKAEEGCICVVEAIKLWYLLLEPSGNSYRKNANLGESSWGSELTSERSCCQAKRSKHSSVGKTGEVRSWLLVPVPCSQK